jgi:hypothetical protein
MTRLHAARQLLRLEPIQFSEFVEVTGWHYRACQRVLSLLQTRGQAKQLKRGLWGAA